MRGSRARRPRVGVLTTLAWHEDDLEGAVAGTSDVLRVACQVDPALASAVRALPRTPWLTVLDARPVHDHVECVVPLARMSLLDALDAGLTASTIERLHSSLSDTLDLLDDHELGPTTLHPDELGFTADGDVLLLPRVGAPADLDEQEADLLVLLEGAAWWADADELDEVHSMQVARPPAGGTEGDVIALSVRPTHKRTTPVGPVPERRRSSAWQRTALLALATATAVLGTGVVLTSQDRPTERDTVLGTSEQAAEVPSIAPADPAALDELISALQVGPALQGPLGPVVLERMQALRTAPAGERTRTEAQDLAAVVAAGGRTGELTPGFADRAGAVLRALAQPRDLDALVAATQVQPQRFGSGVPGLLPRLEGLRGMSGNAARVEARALLTAVRDGVERGVVLASYRDIAVPVLTPLADPTTAEAPAQEEDR